MPTSTIADVDNGFDYSLKLINFKLIIMINILSIFCEIGIRWMPQHLTDHKSTLVQVMAWCLTAPSHYLSQCWPRSLSPYGVTRPQWVNTVRPKQNGSLFTDNIFNCIFMTKSFEFWLKFHRSLFPRFQFLMVINHHWFRSGLFVKKAWIHYLNQWWPR